LYRRPSTRRKRSERIDRCTFETYHLACAETNAVVIVIVIVIVVVVVVVVVVNIVIVNVVDKSAEWVGDNNTTVCTMEAIKAAMKNVEPLITRYD
jgi:hypothetical protein